MAPTSTCYVLLFCVGCIFHQTQTIKVEHNGWTTEIFEGLEIAKSNARIHLPEWHNDEHHRSKRATVTSVYEQYEQEDQIENHNLYRAQVSNAADMNYVTWNKALASQAQEWANKCKFDHGFDANADVSAVYSTVGQNLFMTTAPSYPDEGYVVRAWYNEVSYYTYDTNSCQTGKVCGHYTEVIWSTHKQVGCGRKTCPVLSSDIDKTSWQNALYVVCNYGPGGNIVGQKPYIQGSPCTECSSGSYRCWEDILCRDTCPDEDCTCDVDCNCGTRDDTTCKCTCQTGWTGGRCCKPCEDYHSLCNNGWYSSNCNFAAYIPTNCPKMCGVCSSGGSCSLAANKQCVSGSSSSSSGSSATTTTTAAPASSSTNAVTSSNNNADTTTGSDGSTAAPTTTTTAATTTTTTIATTTTAAQDVEDAQANNGIMFELGGSLQQWPDIWRSLEGILISAINDACNSADQYAACCPNAGPKLSSYQVFVSEETVSIASSYPKVSSTDPNNIQVIIYAEPIVNNTLCQPASSGRRKRSLDIHDIVNQLKVLVRTKRATLASFNFLPQEVLYTAVQSSATNITQTLSSCCNVTVASITKSAAAAPPTVVAAPFVFPDWAIVVCVFGAVFILCIVGMIIYMKSAKVAPKQANCEQFTQTFTDIQSRSTTSVKDSRPPSAVLYVAPSDA